MGLLEALNTDEGRFGLGLLAAAGPRADGAGFGQRLQEGMGSVDAWKQNQSIQKMRDMQMQQAQLQMGAAKRKAEQEAAQAAWRGGLPGVMKQKVYGAGDEGPTMAPDSNALNNYLLHPDSPYADKLMENKLFPKAADFKVVGDSLLRVDANGASPVYTAPAKPESATSDVKNYEYSKGQGYKGTFEQFQIAQKLAGASNISVPVNTGQKGLDNTLKVRGDFRSEPIYKAHGEVQSAHSQITTALKQNSPAGDLAGATKLMKILDPGSVVRESELGMAMAASGLMDRVTNYADMVIKGTKLTPTQRKDFQALSDALLKESQGQYNAKRTEYKGIAERNQLNTEDILGPEPKPFGKSVVKTGLYNGRKVVQYSDGSTDYAD